MTETIRPAQAAPSQLWRLTELELSPGSAHGGVGLVEAARLATGADVASAMNFVDYVRIPVGASIGIHTHATSEEEFYLILEGEGRMHLNGREFLVAAFDLVRNEPGGTHGLVNNGAQALALFVFENSVGS